ncbi:Crp/Fnr family transcriptional regulator [Aquimarina sediminis]|uniref:Crp/Fnr family transcriptional regulator n=1 Tax=Aquimarina sediminis TaxID=2070536 RepID=UPI000CA04FB5|nr:Crp/Fnr family transcriptional regulator [Aquimarina sediminis]
MREKLEKIMPQERVDELIAIGKYKVIGKGEYFIREGEVPKKLGFFGFGLFRYVYINDKGDEFTKGIITEYNFLASYSAMISKTPSHFFIEALERSEILEIGYQEWCDLREKSPFWNSFLIRILEKGFCIKEKREREFLLLDAETRYYNFLKEYPGLESRIKQNIIASYLGIQPESLSRIKRKIQA